MEYTFDKVRSINSELAWDTSKVSHEGDVNRALPSAAARLGCGLGDDDERAFDAEVNQPLAWDTVR